LLRPNHSSSTANSVLICVHLWFRYCTVTPQPNPWSLRRSPLFVLLAKRAQIPSEQFFLRGLRLRLAAPFRAIQFEAKTAIHSGKLTSNATYA
jgi:hypothetical protein